MSVFADPKAYGTGQEYFIVTADQLRQMVLEWSPVLQHDVNRMSDAIRSMVDTDRAKAGLDKPSGAITLWPNKQKSQDAQPDLVGDGRVNGRKYRAAAWLNGEAVKVSLLPAERAS